MRPKPVVGFGDDYSRRGRTHTMNAYVTVETTPVEGGADVRIFPREGFVIMPEVDHETGEVVARIRTDAGPRIGETIRIGGKRTITVAGRRWDSRGHLQVRDEDTDAWYVLDVYGRRK